VQQNVVSNFSIIEVCLPLWSVGFIVSHCAFLHKLYTLNAGWRDMSLYRACGSWNFPDFIACLWHVKRPLYWRFSNWYL